MENFSNEEWETCLKVLNALKDDPFNNPDNQTLKGLITSIYKKAKKINRTNASDFTNTQDAELMAKTTIVANAQNNTTLFSHSEEDNKNIKNLHNAKKCYSCASNFTQLHFFYHKLCPECAELNYNRRIKQHDFSGYNVIITGGRVKIGYAVALKFLRSGANVVVTTRFPALALDELSKEKDYNDWKNRVTVYGLDLRSLKAVNDFLAFCHNSLSKIDILINNAAQTIKYPAKYYSPLITKEKSQLQVHNPVNLLENKTAITFEQDDLLPAKSDNEFLRNRFGQPIDKREKNSWNSLLSEIQTEELLEVNLINHISPYLLISGLKKLMPAGDRERFIINVTSTEGQFSYSNKTIFHPHTNMTKAALNMLTRTSAHEFVKENIYMTAVDVGWVSTGVSESKREKQFDKFNIPPLDPVDGAMRIIHPIEEVMNGDKSFYGVLLKDYKKVDW